MPQSLWWSTRWLMAAPMCIGLPHQGARSRLPVGMAAGITHAAQGVADDDRTEKMSGEESLLTSHSPQLSISKPSVFQRAPSCVEWLTIPTPSLYGIAFGASGFDSCPTFELLTTFIVISSCIAQVSDSIKWVYRVPFVPCWQENTRSALLSNFLDVLVLGFSIWGASMTFPEADRLSNLTHFQGDESTCTSTVFLTGFLCSLLPLFINALKIIIGLAALKKGSAPPSQDEPLVEPRTAEAAYGTDSSAV